MLTFVEPVSGQVLCAHKALLILESPVTWTSKEMIIVTQLEVVELRFELMVFWV
jgi:hypothetical protein